MDRLAGGHHRCGSHLCLLGRSHRRRVRVPDARLPDCPASARDRAGWLFVVLGATAGPELTLGQAAIALRSGWVGLFSEMLRLGGFFAVGYLVLLYPTGHLLSPRWRWAGWLLGFSIVAAVGDDRGVHARLREQIDIDALGAELRTVVERTMQPSRVNLWLRPESTARTG